MRYLSGITNHKKSSISAEQVDQITLLLAHTRTLASMVGLSKSGLAEVAKICNKIITLEAEIDSRLRSVRTMKQTDHFPAIKEAADEASKLIEKDLPRALATLSAFVEKRLPALASSITNSMEDLMNPPKPKPAKKDPEDAAAEPVEPIPQPSMPIPQSPMPVPPKDPNV